MGAHRARIAIAVAVIGSAAIFVGAAGAGKPDVNGTLGVDQAFVIGNGNGNTTVGAKVNFWGAQWWKNNTLEDAGVSDNSAPPSFKGFAVPPQRERAALRAVHDGSRKQLQPTGRTAPRLHRRPRDQIGRPVRIDDQRHRRRLRDGGNRPRL